MSGTIVSSLSLELEDATFVAGSTVNGRVTFKLNQPLEIKEIKIIFTGKGRIKYFPLRGSTFYWTTMPVLSQKFKRVPQGQLGTTQLHPGFHIYPFALTIPAKLPSSWSYKTNAKIEYVAQAQLIIQNHKNQWTKEVVFNVRNELDLNSSPLREVLNKSITEEKRGYVGCLCMKSDSVSLTVRLPKLGYTYNEEIPITMDIKIHDNSIIESVVVELIKILKFSEKDDFQKTFVVKNATFDDANGEKSICFQKSINLGPDKYDHSLHSRLHFISYTLKVEVMPNKVTLYIPIVIGDKGFDQPELQNESFL